MNELTKVFWPSKKPVYVMVIVIFALISLTLLLAMFYFCPRTYDTVYFYLRDFDTLRLFYNKLIVIILIIFLIVYMFILIVYVRWTYDRLNNHIIELIDKIATVEHEIKNKCIEVQNYVENGIYNIILFYKQIMYLFLLIFILGLSLSFVEYKFSLVSLFILVFLLGCAVFIFLFKLPTTVTKYRKITQNNNELRKLNIANNDDSIEDENNDDSKEAVNNADSKDDENSNNNKDNKKVRYSCVEELCKKIANRLIEEV